MACVRCVGVVGLFARKRAPTSAAPAACGSPLAGDASATRAASTTEKSSKCPGWFVGIHQGQTSGKGAALGSALRWHDFPGRPQAGSYVGRHQRLVGARLRATRRLHDQHRPRENRPNARAGLWGYLRLKPAGKARRSGPRSAGMTSQVARKRAPTSAAPAACGSPLAGVASTRRAASTTGKSSKCPGRFVGIPQAQTSGKAAALGSALCWHDFPGRPQAGSYVGRHRRLVGARLRATRRLHEQHRPRENRPNARSGLWGHLRIKPAGKARRSGPRSAGMTSQVARKRAPTSAATGGL